MGESEKKTMLFTRVTQRETTEKNDEKVKSLGFRFNLGEIQTCKNLRFLFSKILIQNDSQKIFGFNRQQNKKTTALVCVSFEK